MASTTWFSSVRAGYRNAVEVSRGFIVRRHVAPRRARDLSCVQDNIRRKNTARVIVACCVQGDRSVTRFFLDYYRRRGADHFLFVDATAKNAAEIARGETDCSIWRTGADVEGNGWGAFWFNALLSRYADGKLAVSVDCDDYLIYPRQTTRSLSDLAQFLHDDRKETMHAIVVDGYAGPGGGGVDLSKGDLFAAGVYFDRDGYIQSPGRIQKTRVQGGPSLRIDSRESPERAPEINRVPVALWSRKFGYRYANRELFPSFLNRAHKPGEVSLSSILLRLPAPAFVDDASRYRAGISVRCDCWERFVDLGLCNPGGWV